MRVAVNELGLRNAAESFSQAEPFPHLVVDNFFPQELACALEREFPPYGAPQWHEYDNPLELKKTCNNWIAFPALTYRVFNFLNSPEIIALLTSALQLQRLYPDSGLNGGGWHVHGRGGKLNTHLDYSIHPNLGLQRKLNLIVYLTEAWQLDWGGGLGLWSHDEARGGPGELVKEVPPLFNRCVLFDTTQHSWHGLPNPLTCPQAVLRKSIAVYYLSDAPTDADARGKALFAPTLAQAADPAVLELIRKRAGVNTAADVYRSEIT